MTETTKEIFEKYQIRKTKEQRAAFREYLTKTAESYGYKSKVEANNNKVYNVVVGDPNSAQAVFTAHYDTCPVMPLPNFITPKSFPIYLLYQLVLTTIMLIIPILVMAVLAPFIANKTGSADFGTLVTILGYALLWVILLIMMKGPANKHTANDNTSGVTLLIDIMRDMPEELRSKVAFIFFDLEELGTVGSKIYKKRHPDIAKSKPVINFDCVSDGKNILFALKKNSAHLAPKLLEAFRPDGTYSVEAVSKGVFYPSDQRNFDLGVGVAALNKTKRGLLYMNRIHTPRDTVYDEENIEFLKNGAIELAKII